AVLRVVLANHDIADSLEPEAAKRVALVLLFTNFGLDLCHLEARGHQAPAFAADAAAVASASARSRRAGTTWSTSSPRRAATARGSSSCLSASTVACTMLMVFDEPSDLLRTSWMPAHSSTARTGPPA